MIGNHARIAQGTIAVVKTLRFGNRYLARVAAAPCQQPENTTAGNTGIVTVATQNFLWMKERIALSILESDKGEEK